MKFKTIIAIFFLIFEASDAQENFTPSSDKRMLEEYKIVAQGIIVKIEKIRDNWKDIEGERVLVSTDYKSVFQVNNFIKGDLKIKNWNLNYSIPGPTYGRYSKSFSNVEAGNEYTVYCSKYQTDDNKMIIEIDIQSESQIKLGNFESREQERIRVENLREDGK